VGAGRIPHPCRDRRRRGGAVNSTALLIRSGPRDRRPRLGEGFTCHPAHILVAEHAREITNDVGSHAKSFCLDRAEEECYILETCVRFPFTTAKNVTGFGMDRSALMPAFPRLQMILVFACEEAMPGNRITINREGRPVAQYRFTPAVVEALVRATRASTRIFFAAAPCASTPPPRRPASHREERDGPDRRAHRRPALQPGRISVSAAHVMCGCGMGAGPQDSVTAAPGRVHGAPWLRVADASLFADSVEINPYLTAMALADRVAGGIRAGAATLLTAHAAARV